jgi:hypothetical protein
MIASVWIIVIFLAPCKCVRHVQLAALLVMHLVTGNQSSIACIDDKTTMGSGL